VATDDEVFLMSRSDTPRQPADWLEVLGKERTVTGTALLVTAGLLLLIPILVGYFWRWEYLDVCLWGGFLALVAAFTGLWQFIREPDRDVSNAEAGRLVVLVVGGLFGLATTILGGFLAYHWWTLAYAGGLELWRKQWLSIVLSQGAMIGGLVVMFISIQVARGQERTNPLLRLLLYGYNAVLSGLLLLYVLSAVNVLAYSRLGPFTLFEKNVDWTEGSLHTLEPASVGILRELNKPVKAYVILSSRREFKRDVEILMNNCRAVNPRFEVEYLSPHLNKDQVGELAKKYKLTAGEGILLVTGTEPNQDSEFIRMDEMVNDLDRNRSTFQGEFALMGKLNTLLEGKTKHVVYFTQGNGEPSLDEAGKGLRLGVLRSRLEGSDYEVKELKVGPNLTKVPDDTEVVIIVRPTLALPENALTALRNYLSSSGTESKRGKLVVAFGVVTTSDGEMVKTGLERILADFGVQVGNDRILNLRMGNPVECLVTGDPTSENPVAANFAPTPPTPWSDAWADVRTIRPQERPPMDPHGGAAGSRYRAEGLLINVPLVSWAETNLRANPRSLAADLRKPDRRQDLEAKVSTKPLPVAVAVNDTQTPGEHDPQPCLAVFGNAAWLDSAEMREGGDNLRFDLFRSTLAWLRGRKNVGKMPDPKPIKEYVPSVNPDTVWRMVWLPATLTVLGIIAVGGGIWLVRRR
jgi:hypothetical protein